MHMYVRETSRGYRSCNKCSMAVLSIQVDGVGYITLAVSSEMFKQSNVMTTLKAK